MVHLFRGNIVPAVWGIPSTGWLRACYTEWSWHLQQIEIEHRSSITSDRHHCHHYIIFADPMCSHLYHLSPGCLGSTWPNPFTSFTTWPLITVAPVRNVVAHWGRAWEIIGKRCRCSLEPLHVSFVVCPEHANMFNILRKPQNISKWFSFTSPSLLFLPAWNYVLETIWPIPILLDFFLKLLSEIDLPHLQSLCHVHGLVFPGLTFVLRCEFFESLRVWAAWQLGKVLKSLKMPEHACRDLVTFTLEPFEEFL